MNDEILKTKAAQAALAYLGENQIIGVGTGTTVNCFIDLLATRKHQIDGCVTSSIATEQRLRAHGFVLYDLTAVDQLDVYFDGADEVNVRHQMIKGGGGALTREKILASAARTFVCMVEQRKWLEQLGQFPIAVEVLPMARSVVARALLKLGGDPVYRQGCETDNGNIIIDTYHLNPDRFEHLEAEINNIPGVVDNGLFIRNRADIVLIANDFGVETHKIP